MIAAAQFDPNVTHYGGSGCLWDNPVGPLPFTATDVIRALRVSAGLAPTTSSDMGRLNLATSGASAARIDAADAACVVRKANGL